LDDAVGRHSFNNSFGDCNRADRQIKLNFRKLTETLKLIFQIQFGADIITGEHLASAPPDTRTRLIARTPFFLAQAQSSGSAFAIGLYPDDGDRHA
jgi:hypothetical protein